jgi:hypothetical protein
MCQSEGEDVEGRERSGRGTCMWSGAGSHAASATRWRGWRWHLSEKVWDNHLYLGHNLFRSYWKETNKIHSGRTQRKKNWVSHTWQDVVPNKTRKILLIKLFREQKIFVLWQLERISGSVQQPVKKVNATENYVHVSIFSNFGLTEAWNVSSYKAELQIYLYVSVMFA